MGKKVSEKKVAQSLQVARFGRNFLHYAKRLASVGIMGDQLRALLKPFNTIECFDDPRGFRGHSISPHDAESCESLGQLSSLGVQILISGSYIPARTSILGSVFFISEEI